MLLIGRRGAIQIIGTALLQTIRVTRVIGIVAVHALVVVRLTCWPISGDKRLKIVLPSGGKGSGNAAGEREFVQRMHPVRIFIELPVRMAVGLLQAVVRPQAKLNRNDVALDAWELIASGRKTDIKAVSSEDLAGHVMAAPHRSQCVSIILCDFPEWCAAVGAW